MLRSQPSLRRTLGNNNNCTRFLCVWGIYLFEAINKSRNFVHVLVDACNFSSNHDGPNYDSKTCFSVILYFSREKLLNRRFRLTLDDRSK